MHGQERPLFISLFLLCIYLSFLRFLVALSEIPLGSRLSVEEKNSWVSSNGDFAIGFFSHWNHYSIGIHFSSNSIPVDKQTVVWVAGADLMVGNSSYFQLTESGDLVLFDSARGVISWTSKTSNVSVASAALLDNGNLVLLNRNKDVIWQSFDNPSDTLLPGQNFSVSQMLRAASKNCISSYYSLYMNASGQLQLKWESSVMFWTSGNPSRPLLHAAFGSSGSFHVLDQRSQPFWSVFGEDHNDSDVKFRFLRLDVDGNLRLYSWVEASKSWRSVWQAVSNQCNVFATCGLNGICMYKTSGSPVCKCPFTSKNESNAKCLAPNGQECQSGFFMVAYEHTSLYGLYPPNVTILQGTSLQKCRSLCQEDPLCTAVTFKNDGTAQCQMETTSYISGQSDPSLSSISIVKTCSDPVAAALPVFHKPTPSPLQNAQWGESHKISVPCLIGITAASFVAFVVIQGGLGFYVYTRKKNTRRRKPDTPNIGSCPNGFVAFSYLEIMEITNNFKHQIEPKLFKAVLPNNLLVVVKDMNAATMEERKFRSAMSKMGNIHHKNLLRLEGYCYESGHRFLVYEYCKNGSVRKFLEDPKLCKRLKWRNRMAICLSVARAMSYLHSGCRDCICHGNLTTAYVVLDEKLEAKVSEFGLGSVNGHPSSSRGGAAEFDIGNFGKMVLELVSGHQNDVSICSWAYEKWEKGLAETVADDRMVEGLNLNELERALRVAFWCLQIDERMRPSMGEVVKVLDGTLDVDPPPPPYACRWPPEEEEEPLESDQKSQDQV